MIIRNLVFIRRTKLGKLLADYCSLQMEYLIQNKIGGIVIGKMANLIF